MKIKDVCRKMTAAAILLGAVMGNCAAVENMRFHGALVEEPCSLRPGDEAIQLDIGTVVNKYLYLNGRTLGKPFEIQLQDCDLSLGKTVSVAFRGVENAGLPGLLALDAGSQAAGVAIGMETYEGQPLVMNKPGGQYPLAAGRTVMQLKAYVQAEPEALAQKSIRLGAFNAIATFSLQYE
jgi:type 1 fimbria pilin